MIGLSPKRIKIIVISKEHRWPEIDETTCDYVVASIEGPGAPNRLSKAVIRSLAKAPRYFGPLLATLAMVMAGGRAHAQMAEDINGLYYTGVTATGALAAGGTQAAEWSVTYASTNGGTTANSTYEGAAYVISPSQVSGSGYTPDTTSAQWVTAPGATNSSGTSPNTGGDFLPGNGNTGSNEGIYIYTLAFTVSGTGAIGSVVSGAVSQIKITMTMAADDQYSIYVNPAGNGTTIPTGTAAASQTNAWNNTTQISLQNFGTGSANNSSFQIGTNYIVVVVDNTNSVTGSSTSTSANASGLLVYQTSAATINGVPVPEVATWLPLLGVISCYGFIVIRRRQALLQPVGA